MNTKGKQEQGLISSHRHVKGRVLVALADGTIAIFHRGAGRSQFVCPGVEEAVLLMAVPSEQMVSGI